MSAGERATAGGLRQLLLRRIGIRFLAVHLLVLVVPIGALVLFDRYEQQLLQLQEEAMVQEARLAVAALSAAAGSGPSPTEESSDDGHNGLSRRARNLVAGYAGENRARIRVLSAQGAVLADTSRLAPNPADRAAATSRPEDTRPQNADSAPRERLLYRLGALPFRVARELWKPNQRSYAAPPELPKREEVLAALRGDYGARTRTDGNSLLIHVALPIPAVDHAGASVGGIQDGVEGVVLVSRSTDAIRARVVDLRLFLFRTFLIGAALAVVVNLLLAATIERPLRRLRKEAMALLDRRGRFRADFSRTDRLDEIGDLTRSLRELAARLRSQQNQTEEFVADLSHELKNPLAAIRSTVDLDVSRQAHDSGDDEVLEVVGRNVARMEHLISDLAELSRLEAGPEDDPPRTDAATILQEVVSSWAAQTARRVHLQGLLDQDTPQGGAPVAIDPDHLARIALNLLDNAAAFTPKDKVLDVSLLVDLDGGSLRFSVRDRGPGIVPGEEERIFERFYSRRRGAPEEQESSPERGPTHQGLGLAVVRALCEASGGAVRASNTVGDGGGARFDVRLPLYSPA